MSYINATVQTQFFAEMRIRRAKRAIYLEDSDVPELHRKRLDKCLNMILCHDPDVWSGGTGVLLVATKVPAVLTPSQHVAIVDRADALDNHTYDRAFRRLQDEGFGFFVRRTLEYRDRTRGNLERKDAYLSYHSIDAIERFERGFSDEFDAFSMEAGRALQLGLQRHGSGFERARSVTHHQSTPSILFRIEHGPCECPNIDFLRGLLFDRFPMLFEDEDEGDCPFACDD
jgi:hypothetical protein